MGRTIRTPSAEPRAVENACLLGKEGRSIQGNGEDGNMGGVRKGGGRGAGERGERAVGGVTCTELTNSHGGSSRGEVGRAANFRGIKVRERGQGD